MVDRSHETLPPVQSSSTTDAGTTSRPSTRRHRNPASMSRTETLRVSHLSVTTQSRFKPLQSSNRRRRRRRRKEECESDDGLRRRWVHAPPQGSCSSFKDKFIIMSYNILGVHNASNHPDLYCSVLSKYLDWYHRKKLILEEINRYCSSILCLQEVDHFDDLNNELQEDGFSGVFKARTGDACDGCAIFWKEERFSLLHQEHIEFRSFGLNNNVAQFCVLQMKSDESVSSPIIPNSEGVVSHGSLLVGNIHVLFNPKRGDVKLGQVRLFLEKAYNLAEDWGKIPVILAGDFNSLPQSALYQLMSSAKLDVLRHDRGRISGQFGMPVKTFQSQRPCSFSSTAYAYRWSDEELRLATGDERVTTLHNDLQLCSAYTRVSGNLRTRDDIGEPLVTSYHSKFMGTVDYIWHTDELHPLRVLETLPVNVLRKMGGLPNKEWGSDHFSLVCEFAISGATSDIRVEQSPALTKKRRKKL